MILEILKRRLWLLLLVPAIAVITTSIVTSKMTPSFVARAELMVDYRRPVQNDAGGEITPAGLQPNYINTLVSVITSYPVALRAVERLNLSTSPDWQAAYRKARLSDEVESSDEAVSPEVIALADLQEWGAQRMLEAVRASSSKRDNLINIVFTWSDPAFAAAGANAFAESFLQSAREFEVNPALDSIRATDGMIARLRSELEASQRRLSAYQQETGILATEERLDIEVARLNELAANRVEAEIAARSAESQREALTAAPDVQKAAENLPEVLNSNLVRSVRLELNRKEAELADSSISLGSQHPTYRKLAAEVGALRSNLRAAIEQIAAGVNTGAQQAAQLAEAARAAEQAQRTKMLQLKTERDGMQPLLREVESARASYGRALELANQYSVFTNLNQTNLAVVNAARPPLGPVGPNMRINVALAFIAGSFLSLALVILLELFGGRVRTREQIESSGEVNVISELPDTEAR